MASPSVAPGARHYLRLARFADVVIRARAPDLDGIDRVRRRSDAVCFRGLERQTQAWVLLRIAADATEDAIASESAWQPCRWGGTLAEKLDAIAGAGFDGIELLDDDLRKSAMSPAECARRCADLGLTIDLYQPFRRAEGSRGASSAPTRFSGSRFAPVLVASRRK